MKKVWSILAVLSMSLTALQAVETSVKQLSVDDFYKMKVYNNFDVSYRQSADSAGVIVIMALDRGYFSCRMCIEKRSVDD